MRRAKRISRRHRRGEITLEWIILGTALVFGIIGGLGVARNAILSELADISQAVEAYEAFPEPVPNP
jgi:hypothetical protein